MTSGLARAVELGGLAKDSVWLARRPHDHDLRQRVVERLASLRGLPRKIGQAVALGELDRDRSPYRVLTEGPAVMSPAEVADAVRRSLGAPPRELFAWFDSVGVGASIGQVHRARLDDGRTVAVKVRYPDIERTLGLDLKSLDWLTLPFGGLSRFDAAAYRAEVGDMLRLELDYNEEAASLLRFGALATEVPGLEVPDLVPSLSTTDVLVMTWLDGDPIEATREWSLGDRVAAGRTLVETFVRGMIQWRLVHADPHPGNLRFRLTPTGPRVGLIDFGCVKRISPEGSDSLARLFRIGLSGRPAEPEEYLAAFTGLGFKPDLLAPMIGRLPAVAALLTEPFISSGPVDLRRAALGDRMAEVLGPDRFNFRAAGPASLLFVIRAWHGLLAHLKHLDAPFSWRDVVERALEHRTSSGVTTPSVAPPVPASRSRFLKIRVVNGGVTTAELTFQAHRAADVADLMPEDLGPKLAAAGIDVATIARKASATQFEPGDLFRYQEGSKQVGVWLE